MGAAVAGVDGSILPRGARRRLAPVRGNETGLRVLSHEITQMIQEQRSRLDPSAEGDARSPENAASSPRGSRRSFAEGERAPARSRICEVGVAIDERDQRDLVAGRQRLMQADRVKPKQGARREAVKAAHQAEGLRGHGAARQMLAARLFAESDA